ncbi:MAG: hypothetical protein H8E36_03910 [Rhodospirillaceae bacterium]|nr:hypothetical protein [Rhodospirillaceae bacterium]MBL6930046.1 hypothetical protein [Rhodospirillales bacterium]MBL6941965.1 hypothetical protein [Rhodospirillales bacterium]
MNFRNELGVKMFSVEVVYLSSYAVVLGSSALTIIIARRAEKAKQPN